MAATGGGSSGEAPVLLFDVMDTIVADPFYTHMPSFFNMSFKELLAAKHPTAWVEFEHGDIDEAQLFQKFFADGRPVDGAGLVDCMVGAYRYVEGMPQLLTRLRDAGHAMHVMSNYPAWYRYIEGKLRLSEYLPWTFVSCEGPMKGLRKPKPAAFAAVAASLALPPSRLLLVDDREVNVEGARSAGLGALHFTGAAALEAALLEHGLRF